MAISRRALLGGAATAALAGGVAASTTHSSKAEAATAGTLPVKIVNNSGSKDLWCYVTGIDPTSRKPVFLSNDGSTADTASSANTAGGKLAAKYAIPASSATTTLNVPAMEGGRIWFGVGDKIDLTADEKSGVYRPEVTRSTGSSNSPWAFCEFAFDGTGVYANTSCVDFVSVPIGLAIGDQKVGGLVDGAMEKMAAELKKQAAKDGAPWDKLIVRDDKGKLLRILSPNLAGADFSGYFEPYVEKVWERFRKRDIVIDLQGTSGKISGRAVGDALVFNAGASGLFHGGISFKKPSTSDIFTCRTGPFTTGNDSMGAVSARLAAAFNRSTLLIGDTFPGPDPAYTDAITNHYSRLVHEVEQDGLGYGFPYDDIVATGGKNAPGMLHSPTASTLTVTVGKPS